MAIYAQNTISGYSHNSVNNGHHHNILLKRSPQHKTNLSRNLQAKRSKLIGVEPHNNRAIHDQLRLSLPQQLWHPKPSPKRIMVPPITTQNKILHVATTK
jgi:hypothetical protein